MDPITSIGTGLTVLGSKEVLNKLLGPTADYLGGELKNLVDKCNINLNNIFIKATKKLGDRINEKGVVSPRVLKHIIDEGRFCEDELTSEYYGGILASSRTLNGRDDRGVTLLAVVKDLSVYQLRSHFLFYSLTNNKFKNSKYNIGDSNECNSKLQFFIPITVYNKALDFSETENHSVILDHSIFGLRRHNLISGFICGDKFSNKDFTINEKGIIISPNLVGAELFLWALGITGASGREIFDINIESKIEGVEIIPGTKTLAELRKENK